MLRTKLAAFLKRASAEAEINSMSDEAIKSFGSKELDIDWAQVKFTPAALKKGMLVELEHQDVTHGDLKLTGQIALAHLKELPDYYERLEDVEKGAAAIRANSAFIRTKLRDGRIVKKANRDVKVTVTASRTGAAQLVKLINYIKSKGNPGHSFDIVLDPESFKKFKKDDYDHTPVIFWDGDGSDGIDSVVSDADPPLNADDEE